MPHFIFRIKRLDQLLGDSEGAAHQLKRVLSAVDLTALGIGAIIGAGIFATTGAAVAGTATRPELAQP